MPLYSNTTTGNHQLTYTSSEQVTKVLPYDSVISDDWTSLPELCIPLGPQQRVVGVMETWYDAHADGNIYIRPKLSDPSDLHTLAPADNIYRSGTIALNLSAATKLVDASSTMEGGTVTGSDPVTGVSFNYVSLLNTTLIDNDTAAGVPPYLKIDNTTTTADKYFRMSFKVVSTDNRPSDFRLQFSKDGSGTLNIENGTRITYSKY
tara:strand:+ start:670 stop:1287 length:618 start_codon:yes stop_codon:yes gene_type:complete